MAAATDMPCSPLSVPTPHTKRLEGSLVAPRKKQAVPNHLADTKLFGRPSSSKGPLQIKPSTIHFRGFNVGSIYKQTLRIVNSSGKNQSMHIIPPETDSFKIKYSKKTSSLIPGLSLSVVVEFQPTEWRHYTDNLRIHCMGEHNLSIPIHGYLVANTSMFPRNLNFPPTPIGQTTMNSLSLKSDVPVDFDFKLTYSKGHTVFCVNPTAGTIPRNCEERINISFTPTEFQTATMELQLEISQFNFIPLICSLSGTSAPGLSVEQIKTQLQQSQQQIPHICQSSTSSRASQQISSAYISHQSNGTTPDGKSLISTSLMSSLQPAAPSQEISHSFASNQSNHSLSSQTREDDAHLKVNDQCSPTAQSAEPAASSQSSAECQTLSHSNQSFEPTEVGYKDDASKTRKKLPATIKHSSIRFPEKKNELGIQINGFHVPANIDTHSAVRKIMLQEPGKLKASQLKQAGDGDIVVGSGSNRQIKEAGFLQAVKQGVSEEKANLFRWVTHLGGSPPTAQEKQATINERTGIYCTYQDTSNISVSKLCGRNHVEVLAKRTRRRASQEVKCNTISFDSHKNNQWASRLHVQLKFLQAIRKTMVRLRAQDSLDKLETLRKLMTPRESVEETISQMYPKKSSLLFVKERLVPKSENCLQISFPKFSGQIQDEEKQSVLKRSLDKDPVTNKKMSLSDSKDDVSYLDLQVPQQSDLLGYSELLTPKVNSYIPTGFHKQFLSGAEGELESLGHIPGVDPSFLTLNAFTSPLPECQAKDRKSSAEKPITSSPIPAVHFSKKKATSFTSIKELSVECEGNKKQELFRWKTIPEIILPDTDDSQLQNRVDKVVRADSKVIELPDRMLDLPIPSALRVLDPSPEVVDYFSLLPNSEAELDHALLPLPLYSSSKYPTIRLDPLDVIPGLMTWKKFPSPCLSALENKKKLSSCWKPFRSDPFSVSSLLPLDSVEAAPILTEPQDEDRNAVNQSSSDAVGLSMESIKNMFLVPTPLNSKTEPITTRKQTSAILHESLSELEDHHLQSFNQLGDSIKSRLDAFLDLDDDMDTHQ